MLYFTGETTQGKRIHFGFNDIRHIERDSDLVVLDRPKDILVKFSTVEVDTYPNESRRENYPLAFGLAYQ